MINIFVNFIANFVNVGNFFSNIFYVIQLNKFVTIKIFLFWMDFNHKLVP